ncbi:glycosyltransferase family 4 protein [Taibaiella lutea]|uniref:Glycosyltransferase family 4 protein n=1 Tax=Taibaiella lutea TaxID=2608001 RepID=A0A5M6CFF5_9BACT|nr:glycosyltransferase family 4 protein [Taibaiella lutea]KAA5533776.1 glycosyltransferase family 4 protein [Taibaiella lutea]
MNIIYFGNGSFKAHKRGIENVIDIQIKSVPFKKIYYLHWGSSNTSYKHEKYICISLKNSFTLFFAINKILKRIKSPDTIIHSHNPLMSFCYLGKTDIFSVHDGLFYQAKSEGAGLFKLFAFYLIEKVNYRRAGIVHFISVFTKKMSLFGNKSNYCIIPNTSFMEQDVVMDELRPNLPLDDIENKIINVLSVRSIEERARFDLLLAVAQKLKKTHQFTVAGKGPLLEFYKNEVIRKGIKNLEFLGFVSDAQLKTLYKQTDLVLTLAQYGEGFGLPIIEGYLFNKPVYASDVCAMPEVIINNDYIFDNTTESIVAKLQQPKFMSGMAYRLYYDNKYANGIILQQVKNLYETIL